jgi:Tfp pilus assembly protein PilP
MTRHVLVLMLCAGLASPAAAQQPPAAAVAPPAAVTPDAQLPVPPAGFSYGPDGRRDPFVSLVRTGGAAVNGDDSGPKAEGVAGVRSNELVVRGILQGRNGFVAMIAAPSGKTYIVHAGDKLADGTIRAITSQALVIMQVVNDPLSLDKQREVRKPLRVQEEGK